MRRACTSAGIGAVMTITLPLARGPYRDNGASPWYASVGIGTGADGGPAAVMKLALDTGTNLVWATSTQCTSDACTRTGRVRFDPGTSSTFEWVDRGEHSISYGPWGTMHANVGRDAFMLGSVSLAERFYLATDYRGKQFAEMEWDGCIGFPSSTAQAGTEVTFAFQELVRKEGRSFPAVATFACDFEAGSGTCTLGGVDPASVIADEWLWLPFEAYGPIPSVDYIWSTRGATLTLGAATFENLTFCADTGSSRFKGDDTVMNACLAQVAPIGVPYPPLSIDVGLTGGGRGRLELSGDEYMREIDGRGGAEPQFHPFGTIGLLLVGSVLLDHVTAVYVYDRVEGATAAADTLAPLGVMLFNKPGGPKVVTGSGPTVDLAALLRDPKSTIAAVTAAPVRSVGSWVNGVGSVMNLAAVDPLPYGPGWYVGSYGSDTGSTGTYLVVGHVDPDVATVSPEGPGAPAAFALSWWSTTGAEDPSWHWVSGMAGQYVATADGTPGFLVQHGLTASGDWPALEVAPATFIGDLTFVPHGTGATTWETNPLEPAAVEGPNASPFGRWTSTEDATLGLELAALNERTLVGRFSDADGSRPLLGVYDGLVPPGPGAVRAVSMVTNAAARPGMPPGRAAVSLSGTVDAAGTTMRLSVMRATSRAKGSSYLQTAAERLTFTLQAQSSSTVGVWKP